MCTKTSKWFSDDNPSQNNHIDVKGKYLGFVIGPGAGQDCWNAPLQKFERRWRYGRTVNAAYFWNSIYYTHLLN